MRLMLDTSVLIEVEHENPSILDRLLSYKPREVGLSVIAFAEFQVGVLKGTHRRKNQAVAEAIMRKYKPLPFDRVAGAAVYAMHVAPPLPQTLPSATPAIPGPVERSPPRAAPAS